MYKRILVPVDGSGTAGRGVDEAIRLARLMDGTLHFFHAIDEHSVSIAMQSCAAFSDDWRRVSNAHGDRILQEAEATSVAAGVRCRSALSSDLSVPVAKRVIDEAGRTRAGLIVMGTHGRRGFKRLVMGSSAEAVLRESPVPVLLVHDVDPPRRAGSSRERVDVRNYLLD